MALQYLERGLSVIPTNGKKPLIRWREYQVRRPTREEVLSWWGRWPGANVAVVCGEVSGGLVVVDVDDGELADKLVGLFDFTWLVKTKRGLHIYLRAPGNVRTVRRGKFEVRGEGSYVIAPPSRHPEGGTYKFVSKPGEPFRVKEGAAIERVFGLLLNCPHREFPSRSEGEQSLLFWLIKLGLGRAEAEEFLLRASELGFSVAEKAGEEVGRRNAQYLRRSAARAEEFAMKKEEIKELVEGAMGEVMRAKVPERWGKRRESVRNLLLGLLYVARKYGKVKEEGGKVAIEFHASARKVAEEWAGISTRTVLSLMKEGEFEVGPVSARILERGRGIEATKWRVCIDVANLHHKDTGWAGGVWCKFATAFHGRGGLKTGLPLIATLLLEDPPSAGELAGRLGWSKSKVSRVLRRLREEGIVSAEGRLSAEWEKRVAEVAWRLSPLLERRKVRIREEREEWQRRFLTSQIKRKLGGEGLGKAIERWACGKPVAVLRTLWEEGERKALIRALVEEGLLPLFIPGLSPTQGVGE